MRTNVNKNGIVRIIASVCTTAMFVWVLLATQSDKVHLQAYSRVGSWANFKANNDGIAASCATTNEACKAILHLDSSASKTVVITLTHRGLVHLTAKLLTSGSLEPIITQRLNSPLMDAQTDIFAFDLKRCSGTCRIEIETSSIAANSMSISAEQEPHKSLLPYVAIFLAICLWVLTEIVLRWRSLEDLVAYIGWMKSASTKPALLEGPQKELIDPLTDALNRKGFEQRAAIAIASHPGQAALCVIDLDRFKYINDAYGRAAGDELLAAFSNRMKKAIRSSDCLARWGGEEFVVLSLQPSERAASKFAAKLCAVAANEPFKVKGSPELQVTVSIGLAQHDLKESFNSWFLRADAALFHAKQSGKNRVCIAPSEREA